jgi:hypothetical protein
MLHQPAVIVGMTVGLLHEFEKWQQIGRYGIDAAEVSTHLPYEQLVPAFARDPLGCAHAMITGRITPSRRAW